MDLHVPGGALRVIVDVLDDGGLARLPDDLQRAGMVLSVAGNILAMRQGVACGGAIVHLPGGAVRQPDPIVHHVNYVEWVCQGVEHDLQQIASCLQV